MFPASISTSLQEAGEVNVIEFPLSSSMVSITFTPVRDTLPVLVTVIVYWMMSPGPFMLSPLSTTTADLVTSNDGVALIKVITLSSISSDTAVLSPSSAVAVTDAVFETPPASIAA